MQLCVSYAALRVVTPPPPPKASQLVSTRTVRSPLIPSSGTDGLGLFPSVEVTVSTGLEKEIVLLLPSGALGCVGQFSSQTLESAVTGGQQLSPDDDDEDEDGDRLEFCFFYPSRLTLGSRAGKNSPGAQQGAGRLAAAHVHQQRGAGAGDRGTVVPSRVQNSSQN